MPFIRHTKLSAYHVQAQEIEDRFRQYQQAMSEYDSALKASGQQGGVDGCDPPWAPAAPPGFLARSSLPRPAPLCADSFHRSRTSSPVRGVCVSVLLCLCVIFLSQRC